MPCGGSGRTASADETDCGRGHGEERRLHELPYDNRFADNAYQPGGDPRLRRLSRRQSHCVPRARSAAWKQRIPPCSRCGTCPAAFSRGVELSLERQAAAHIHLAEPRVAGVHPLSEPERLSRRPRGLWRLPPPYHRGGRAQPDGDDSDVLGGRRLQQRHPAVQAHDRWRGLYARRTSQQSWSPR